MNLRGSLRCGRVHQAEHLAGLFIDPVLQVLHPVLVLGLHVGRVRSSDVFRFRSSGKRLVYIHEERHRSIPFRLGQSPRIVQRAMPPMLQVPTTTPPSTLSTAPLMKLASSDARKRYAFATSRGSPMRRTGVRSTMLFRIASGICRTISVAMKPGATALTVMPFGPSSRAQTFVRPMTPAFVAT